MGEPTKLGLLAITPAPMTSDQVSDLVSRVRGSKTVASVAAEIASRARWDRLQALERARQAASQAAPPAVRRRKGRSGEPSAISSAARAALDRTAAAKTEDHTR